MDDSSKGSTVPEFIRMSSAFRIGKANSANFSGMAIASRDAFYLVVGQNAVRMGLELGGGLIGAALGAALERLGVGKADLSEVVGLVETNVADLPAAVVQNPDWPLKSSEPSPVLIIPRRSVRGLRYSFWMWGLFIDVDKIEFRIEPPFFGRQKLLDTLREMGWTFET